MNGEILHINYCIRTQDKVYCDQSFNIAGLNLSADFFRLSNDRSVDNCAR